MRLVAEGCEDKKERMVTLSLFAFVDVARLVSGRRCGCLATAADCPSDEAEKADGCAGGFRYGAAVAAKVGCCCERLQVRGVDDRLTGYLLEYPKGIYFFLATDIIPATKITR